MPAANCTEKMFTTNKYRNNTRPGVILNSGQQRQKQRTMRCHPEQRPTNEQPRAFRFHVIPNSGQETQKQHALRCHSERWRGRENRCRDRVASGKNLLRRSPAFRLRSTNTGTASPPLSSRTAANKHRNSMPPAVILSAGADGRSAAKSGPPAGRISSVLPWYNIAWHETKEILPVGTKRLTTSRLPCPRSE